MKSSKLLKTTALAFASIVMSTALIDNAEARDRQRSGSYTTAKGHSGTYNKSVSGNRQDGLTRNRSVTTENGKTYNRNSTGTYDRETGEFNKTTTGANGNTRTVTGTAQDGERSGSYTTNTGKSGTFKGAVERNDGVVTRNGSWTNQDGQTYNRSATNSYNKETHTITHSVTGPGGNTRDNTVTIIPTNP